ncbi:MAG: hypothetical protein H0V73_11000 [Chloroflexi bacterium]|nr:hypothetical protein [Chloroflexota bacterium]
MPTPPRRPRRDVRFRWIGLPRLGGTAVASVALCGLLLTSSGCTSTPSAALRIKNAAAALAPRLGQTAEDVAARFFSRFSGQTEEAIGAQAERAVAKTAWLDTFLAHVAQNRVKIAKVAHGAACDWIEISDAFAETTDEARLAKLAAIIVGHIRAEGLDPDEAELREIADTVLEQVDKLENGTLDPGALATDFACLF